MATRAGQGVFVYCNTVKHDADVRCVAPHPNLDGGLITASYDKTAKVWMVGKAGEESETVSTFVGHTGWVGCVTYLQGSAGSKSFMATSGWDKNLVLWDLESCQPEWLLEAHTDKVTCIAALRGGEIITGGYDKTAILWKDGYLVKKLTNHTAPVACACGLENGDAVTGGAHGDNSLMRWSSKGELLKVFKSHTSGVRGVASVSATEFVSCSNDMTLILWSINGAVLQTFAGHKNQVYSVAVLPSGEFVSGSEDKTVKVWNIEGGCIQTIPMQSFVFSVCALANGDIAAGCTDGTARIFTRSPERVAPEDKVKAFNDEVANQKISKGGLSGLDMATLPGREALQTAGVSEGQQKIIKSEKGAEVYCWTMAKQAWEKVGDVVDGDGEDYTGPTKVVYKGKEWDYVFDVDLTGDGNGMFRLPYNKGENPYEAAQRFIHDHTESGITNNHLDQIAKFIFDNAEGTGIAAISADACVSDYAREAAAAAASGTSSMSNIEALRKMEKEGTSTAFSEYAKEAAAAGIESTSIKDNMKKLGDGDGLAYSAFAQEAAQLSAGQSVGAGGLKPVPEGVLGDFTTFTKINPEGMAKKLLQQNTEQPAIGLDTLLAGVDAMGSGALATIPVQVASIFTKWSAGQRFAAIDFLRQAVLSPTIASAAGSDPILSEAFTLFMSSDIPAAVGPEMGLCLKAYCNLFATPAGRGVAEGLAVKTFDSLQKLWRSAEPPVRVLYATLLLSFARHYREQDKAGSVAADMVPTLCTGLLYDKEPAVIGLLLNALGCLMLPGSGKPTFSMECASRAKRCFLQDSLRAIIPPTVPATETVSQIQVLLSMIE
eukprot:TRINITY_DN600_c1_g1_i1.p1 TRINITY_DN600_c1_g1~~TRINITY_DN600_c1_g1_i1.p1  ORF type:complete len:844 (+),score=220.56 TRINITY_DN600_c1_g1_i1:46-2532(+)